MSDSIDPPEPAPEPGDPAAEAGAEAGDGPGLPEDDDRYPWDEDPPPADPDAPRERHDAFTEAKKCVWLRALVKTGCIQDACRRTGVSPRTIYRYQQSDPIFFEHCRIALRVSGTPAELTAWSRAVEGVEQEFACGGQVHVRRRYSDGLLRLILQGSNPKKYGPNPGFKRKRILKYERKQIERELRAELAAKEERWSFDDAMKLLGERLDKMDMDGLMARYSPGWTRTEDGHWIPPGYGPIPGWQPPAAGPAGDDGAGGDAAPGADTPRDSV
jgi:hypothetical protein